MARNKAPLEKLINMSLDHIENSIHAVLKQDDINITTALTIIKEWKKDIYAIKNYCEERKRY